MITTTPLSDLTGLYARVQQFYAQQMHALDGGDFAQYAATFTPDGEFSHTPGRPPARTREGIAAELHAFHEQRFGNDPVRRRHWFNMIRLAPGEDGTIRSTFYVLVVTSRPGVREPEIAPSCVVHDVLVEEGGELFNRSRRVDHDYLGIG
ncbi:nuclear transport factor 2 family protein [Streptomyces gobiensis]|uniref:nuclear transport factor 2 family protein n=1 Tax=Streptomyces gobiensis TaxID=2875706 RepID=UPI001E58FD59|nr:nuclear transport factor 2 family protein [Streptomyces gobiensis]UGY93004.1 nuclear transport factor 2 family protein [Streptomyces gobiensis]